MVRIKNDTRILRNLALPLLILFGCAPPKDKESNATAGRNDLPLLEVSTTDGKQLHLKDLSGKVVLVLFQTDCDHCQREATAIQENLSAFKDYSLYFISTTALHDIDAFASEYKLKGYDNVHFCGTSNQMILNSFGPIDAPSLYIYSDKMLVKSFNGETNISEILKYI